MPTSASDSASTSRRVGFSGVSSSARRSAARRSAPTEFAPRTPAEESRCGPAKDDQGQPDADQHSPDGGVARARKEKRQREKDEVRTPATEPPDRTDGRENRMREDPRLARGFRDALGARVEACPFPN